MKLLSSPLIFDIAFKSKNINHLMGVAIASDQVIRGMTGVNEDGGSWI